jgi:hypothetical protein
MNRRSILLAACISSLAGTARAAQDAPDCAETYEKSQTLMKASGGQSTLLPARDMLRSCVRSSCKEWVVAECSRWLEQVEARIPTVVFSARDTAGRDLTETTISTVEGAVLAPRLDGRAIDMEPGEHVFVFIAPDGARSEKRVLVREGEKAQGVAAIFGGPVDESGPVIGAERHGTETPTLRYVGYGAIAVGAVALGLSGLFGLRAVDKKDAANCVGNVCDGPALEDARSAAWVSALGFVAGTALVAGGVGIVLFTPKAAPLKARVSIGPTGLDLSGRF